MGRNRVNADEDLAKQLIAGMQKRLANVGQLTFGGSSYTPADVTTQLQAIVQLRADVDAANAAAKEKHATWAAQMPARRAFMDAFVSFVKATFGNSHDALADFGLTPKKARAPLTVQQKAAAAAKREATRAARHTMGSKQRKTVKGAVTGVVVTPVVAPQPVAPASNGQTAPAVTAGATGPATHTA